MANAFFLKPLPIVAAPSVLGTLQAGSPSHVFNDFSGIVCQIACDTTDAQPNEARIQFDVGYDQAFDTVMIFGLELLPQSATLRIDYATSASVYGADTTSAYAGAVLPVSQKGVALWMAPTPATARYFSLSFAPGSPGKSVRIARIVVGTRLQPAIGFEYGAQQGIRDLGSLDVNARGVLLRHRGKKLRTTSLNFPSLSKDEAERAVLPLLEYAGNTEGLALCTNSEADPLRQLRCFYGPLVGDLGAIWRTARAWEWRANHLSLF